MSRTFDKEAIFARMVELGIGEARIQYDGYGDDGEIGDVEADGVDGDYFELDDDMESFLREAASSALYNRGIDWYNSEGGFGEVTFNAVDRRAFIEHNARYEAYHTSNLEA